MVEKPIVIKTAESDNVGVIVNLKGLPGGTLLEDGTCLSENIPSGHKVALSDISRGASIIRYGQIIGHANKQIMRGEWIRESMVSLPQPPDLDSIPLINNPVSAMEPLEGYTFKGYRNPDGSVGTKNILGITSSVNCITGFTGYITRRIKAELLPRFPNVDDVVPLNHTYGCGVAINAPGAEIPERTIRNIASNPNFGGRILIVGLGCEKLLSGKLLPESNRSDDGSSLYASDIMNLQDESYTGFHEMAGSAMDWPKSI
jgi:galactarate dehydratase